MTRRIPLDLAAVRAGLRDFQLKTVDHVVARMFDPAHPSDRFLVADEVGLGKTFVAKGIIAETIARLKDEVDVVDGVERPRRIDVVYVCSNAQIARQNMRRINPLPQQQMDLADRLTLLPNVAKDLNANRVNMISLTPGTSLHLGNAGGRWDERRVLYWLLRKAWGSGPLRRRGSIEVLRVGMGAASFKHALGARAPKHDRVATESFILALNNDPDLRSEFDRLTYLARLGRDRLSYATRADMNRLVGNLRVLLARASIATLEPDLVILDEFQRFSDLLDGDSEAALLANSLFGWQGVKVLLLSATPYRMYTVRGDAEEDGDHFGDLMRTVRFLMNDENRSARLAEDLSQFRRALASQHPIEVLEELQARITEQLRSVMVRTERIAMSDPGVRDVVTPDLIPSVTDLRAFLGVERLSRQLGAGSAIDYWETAPYLLSFLEGYQLRRKVDESSEADKQALSTAVRTGSAALNGTRIKAFRQIDAGHPKLRQLVEELDSAAAFDLAWVPPSLLTTTLAGPYARAHTANFTKRLVFSAWQAAPRSVASMLSYEAERRTNGGRSKDYTSRKSRHLLGIRGRNREPADMSKFALLLPVPYLASLGDPRRFARRCESPLPVDPAALLHDVGKRIHRRLSAPLASAAHTGPEDDDWYWLALLLLDDDPSWVRRTSAYAEEPVVEGEDPEGAEATHSPSSKAGVGWLQRHADRAGVASDDVENAVHAAGRPPRDLIEVLSLLAVAGPANAAWRALDNVIPSARGPERAEREHLVRDQAADMALSLRSMFQQPEIEGIVIGSTPDSLDYWRAVMRHSLDGGLPAVLEEDLHWLAEVSGVSGHSWAELRDKRGEVDCPLARDFGQQAGLKSSDIRVTSMRASGAAVHRRVIPIRHHFAVRFGAKSKDEKTERRSDNTREAFNGPFWPFVLVSTSVGQEGLDFQPYSHAVVHWNLPHNPVDLEQREGRVNRYKGHAVRKNVALAFGSDPSVLEVGDPWAALFAAASQAARQQGLSDLIPFWLYPVEGGAVIERHVPMLALSREVANYRDLIRTLGLYRLSFGQPRQEDLIELLSSAYGPEELDALVARLGIDLTPDENRPGSTAERNPDESG